MTSLRRCFRVIHWLLALTLASAAAWAQVEGLKDSNPKRRARAAERLGNQGNPQHIPALAELFADPVGNVRAEAVHAIVKIGGPRSLEPLIRATRDAAPEIQMLAADGLVNFYSIGYVRRGFGATFKKFGSSLKNRFVEPTDLVIDPYLRVSPEVISAVAGLVTGGSSMESRANAARAAGILRAKPALPQLVQALRSKDTTLMVEAVSAIEKIGDVNIGPSLVFLLRDFDQRVQLTVIKATGQLLVREAVPELVAFVKTSRNKKVRRQSLISLAKVNDPGQRALFKTYLRDRDKQMRAAAAEGLGRLGNAEDLPPVREAFAREKSESPRLSLAFAAVHLGDFSYLSYLYDGLNSTFHRREAQPFLVELARKPEVLEELYKPLAMGTNDQKRELADVIWRSGGEDSVPHLKKLMDDPDPKVAQAAIRALKNLQARL